MRGKPEFVKNKVGRRVPTMGERQGAGAVHGARRVQAEGRQTGAADSVVPRLPPNGDKRVKDLKTALKKCGLRDGMVISNHHHFRDGDKVALAALQAAAELGVKNLMWFPSASFPCQEPVIDLMDRGVVHHIEGSMNGPLGRYCSYGNMKGLGVLRSHGGRWQAIQDGEVHVDIAVIAAPTADPFGNADGSHGPSACGSLYFALADSMYADHVIVVTDNLVPFPCVPWHIQGNNVDYVVEVDSIGDPVEDRFRDDADHEEPRPSSDLRVRRAVPSRRGDHARRVLVPGGLRRHRARVRRVPQGHDARSGGQGAVRPRRIDAVPRRHAQRGAHRLHSRRTDLRPRRRAVDGG